MAEHDGSTGSIGCQRSTTPRISPSTISAYLLPSPNATTRRPTISWCVPLRYYRDGSGVEPPYRVHADEAVVDVAITTFGHPIRARRYDDDNHHGGAAEFPKVGTFGLGPVLLRAGQAGVGCANLVFSAN